MRKLHKNRGFSLVELIITLLVGSILLAWGVPNYRDFKIRKQIVDTTNEFVYGINFARAEAIRYGGTVRHRARGAARDWSNGTFTLEIIAGAPNRRIAEIPPYSDSIDITQSGNFTGDLDFNSIGALANGSSTQFRIENPNVANAFRIVQVMPSGLVRLIRP